MFTEGDQLQRRDGYVPERRGDEWAPPQKTANLGFENWTSTAVPSEGSTLRVYAMPEGILIRKRCRDWNTVRLFALPVPFRPPTGIIGLPMP